MEKISLIISVLGLSGALTSLYFSFIRPSKIKVLLGNVCKVYYTEYNEDSYMFGIYLPVDIVNITNKTGIVLKTALSFYKKDQPTERFLMLQRSFSKLDVAQNKWVYDEIAHSMVIAAKTSVSKIIWFYWAKDSSPKIKLQKGEYVLKLYYWTKLSSKAKFVDCDLYIDDKIETTLNNYFFEKKSTTVEIILNKEFDFNNCITEKEEEKIMK